MKACETTRRRTHRVSRIEQIRLEDRTNLCDFDEIERLLCGAGLLGQTALGWECRVLVVNQVGEINRLLPDIELSKLT